MNTVLTLDALRVLDAIDRKQSFAAAAESLHRVPSAISYTVNKLEDDLGVELFDRSKRRAEFTAAGKLLLEQGRHILRASHELGQMTQAVATGWEAELTIAVDTAFGYERLLHLIHSFQAEGHLTELILKEEVLGGVWEALINHRCDLVLGAEGTPPGSDIITHPIGQLSFVFAVAANHPLIHKPQPLTREDIQAFSTVVVADSSRYSPGKSIGILEGRTRLVVASMAQKIQAHVLGLGVGYLPVHKIQPLLEDGRLVALPLADALETVNVCAAWRRGYHGHALDWFIRHIRADYFSSVPQLHDARL